MFVLQSCPLGPPLLFDSSNSHVVLGAYVGESTFKIYLYTQLIQSDLMRKTDLHDSGALESVYGTDSRVCLPSLGGRGDR